jgi:SecD/SecF fusion protein
MTKRNLVISLVLLLIFAFFVCTLIYPLFGRKEIRLGLDLVGGVHLVYQAQFPENATAEDKVRDMSRALTTIENRIDWYGVTEPIIQQMGSDRIMVQLPGFTDIEAAKSLVEQTGFLEFREVELNSEGNPVHLSDYLDNPRTGFIDTKEEGSRIFVDEEGNPITFLVKDENGLKFVDKEGNAIDAAGLPQYATSLSWIPARGEDGTQLTGDFLTEAAPTIKQKTFGAKAEVAIKWDKQGTTIFDQIAQRLYNSGEYGVPQRALGIFLDSALISSPQILESAYHGSAGIQGNFSVKDAERLANLLESGALPMPLNKPPLYQDNISATLGANFIEMSLKAGLIGLALVMLFMIAYYRLPGAMSSLALIFYGASVLALFKLIPVTLNLAGLGGFILSIGMAVDANVLIFERMKEEFRMGRSLGAAIEVGFDRAWSAIRDSNMTTLIVCAILYWLGSSIVASAAVKGFALTLAIGVLVSMFTAVVVTRTLLRLFVSSPLADRFSLFSPVWVKASSEPPAGHETDKGISFDIIGKRLWFFLISGVVIIAGLISLTTVGLKTGVEFSSGSVLTVKFEQVVAQEPLKQEIASLGYNAIIQQTGRGEFLIRTQELTDEQKKELENTLAQRFGQLTETEFSSVSPIVAAETARNVGIAVAVAAIGVLLYVTWAFRRMPNPFRYGTCAIVALAHDALVPLGIFSILGAVLNWQVNLMFVTGILAVVGYSVNDTVVIFDRIRENLKLRTNPDFELAVNNSLVETMGRSLNTSLTTLFTVLALLLFVGATIQNFAVVLLIGIVAGTYSSICIASPFLVIWEGRKAQQAVPVP